VCPNQGIDSECGSNTTIAQSLQESDALFASPSSGESQCAHAACITKEINNGHALELDSLSLAREGAGVRLRWTAPRLDDGTGTPKSYEIWRRPMGSAGRFAQIGGTTGLAFLDTSAAAGNWQYSLTVVLD
jgi:hypothetical protein